MTALIRIFIVSACLILSNCFWAQDYSISGTVKDIDGNPIEFANVIVLENTTSEFLKGTSTDDKGYFSLVNLSAKTYILKISYIGFKEYEQIIILEGDLDLKTIQLEASAETLDQIDIIARRPTITRKPDRLVFNIENTALTEGSTLGALKSTPGVIVSDGSINIRSAPAAVFINNRRVQLSAAELIQLLESSPANSIKSVEVITNPPASYDADSGAVINIVMSKNLIAGYRGSIFSNFTQGVFPRYNTGTSHYFKNDKINVNVNYSYTNKKENRDNDDIVDFLNLQNQIDQVWRSGVNRNTWSETHNLNLNFDYYINSNNTISLTSTGLYMPYFKYVINNNTNITDANSGFLSRFTADNLSRDNKYNVGTDLIFTHSFKDNSDFSISGHYTTYNYERDQNVFSNFFDNNNQFSSSSEFNTIANQDTQIINAKADYNLPIDEKTSFSSGVKYSNVKTDSDITRIDIINGQEVINTNNTDAFEYDEKVYAAYANFNKSWDKWELNLGMRVEQTNIEGESQTLNQTNTQDYLNWFPTISISHDISEEFGIYATYNRSITRPNYTNLNPFSFFLNENTVVVGNPNLVPTYVDSYRIGTNFLKYFSLSAYYMNYDGNILELPRQNNNSNIIAFTPANLDKMVDFGFDLTADFSISNRWTVSAFTSFYNLSQETQFGIETVSLERWSNYSSLKNNLRLLKDNSLVITFGIDYVNTYLQDLALVSDLLFSELSIVKSILKGRATVSLSIQDIFNAQDFDINTDYLDQSNNIFTDLDNRFIKLGFRYNFGNTKLSTNERATSAEERKRLGKSLD